VTTEQAAGSPGTVLREAAHDDLPTLVALARAFYDEDGFTTSTAMLEENFGALLDSSGGPVGKSIVNVLPDAGPDGWRAFCPPSARSRTTTLNKTR
jgi:hypothetical protein